MKRNIAKFCMILISFNSLISCKRIDDSSINSSSSQKEISSSESSSISSESPSLVDNSNNLSSSSIELEPNLVTVFSVNDVHGKLANTSKYSGIVNLQGAICSNQYYDENSFIVSAGDMWQGSYQSGYDKGYSTTNLLNDFPLKAMTLGNHEFDWGFSQIETNASNANYPFLCANLLDKDTLKRPDCIKSHIVITTNNNAKIGLVGAIGMLTSSIKDGMLGNLFFTSTLSYLQDAYNECINEGADVVILLAHDDKDSGYINTIQASSIPFIGIFGGHSHQFQLEKQSNNLIPYIQGGSDSNGYSYMQIDTANKKLVNYNYVEINASTSYTSYCDVTFKAEIDQYLADHVAPPVGYMTGSWTKEKTKTFVTKAMFEMGQILYPDKNYSTDNLIAIHNTAGIRGSFPSSSSTYEVSMEEIQIVSPFDNKVMLLEDRTLSSKISSHVCYPAYTSSLDSKTYDIITIDYLVSDRYNPNIFHTDGAIEVTSDYASPYYIYDLIAEYINTHSTSTNPIDASDF